YIGRRDPARGRFPHCRARRQSLRGSRAERNCATVPSSFAPAYRMALILACTADDVEHGLPPTAHLIHRTIQSRRQRIGAFDLLAVAVDCFYRFFEMRAWFEIGQWLAIAACSIAVGIDIARVAADRVP